MHSLRVLTHRGSSSGAGVFFVLIERSLTFKKVVGLLLSRRVRLGFFYWLRTRYKMDASRAVSC